LQDCRFLHDADGFRAARVQIDFSYRFQVWESAFLVGSREIYDARGREKNDSPDRTKSYYTVETSP
jgi:hypothetical protein